jgi:hypothetical protein
MPDADKVFVDSGHGQVGYAEDSVTFTAAEVGDSIVAALERGVDNMRAQLRELGRDPTKGGWLVPG